MRSRSTRFPRSGSRSPSGYRSQRTIQVAESARCGWAYAPRSLVAALPWIAADLGFHFGAGVFRSGQLFEGTPSVHLGHHHGLDGALLAVTAILLWRAPDRMRRRRLRALTRGYLALMLSYGLVNAANDFWDEQVVKRGWATRMIPNALVPSVSVIWLIVLTGAVAFYALGSARRDIVPPTGDNPSR